MSDDIAIALKDISKIYKRYQRPVDRLTELLFPGDSDAEDFWALKNVSLEISKGETVGIIGRNGSGKSTLLQIITGTLQQTSGEVEVQGRISALLELGSGFNPEFTGRQNIFFNGQILGLSTEEIEARFDRIVAFADIGDFIDEPLKTYSSGMMVRLAFAVAINTEPDVLIVDEALSVGDEAFQRKCFTRLYEFQQQGVTILFVSHAASSIVELCDRAVLLDQGELIMNGLPKNTVAQYQKFIYAPKEKRAELRDSLKGMTAIASFVDGSSFSDNDSAQKTTGNQSQAKNGSLPDDLYDPNLVPQQTLAYEQRGAIIKDTMVKNATGKQVNLLCRNRQYIYCYQVFFSEERFKVRFGMMIKTITGFELGGAASHAANREIECIPANSIVDVRFSFVCALVPGTYFLNAGVLGRINGEDVYLDRVIDTAMFKVQPEAELRTTGIIDFNTTTEVLINTNLV